LKTDDLLNSCFGDEGRPLFVVSGCRLSHMEPVEDGLHLLALVLQLNTVLKEQLTRCCLKNNVPVLITKYW
jgi:hypothetical protein